MQHIGCSYLDTYVLSEVWQPIQVVCYLLKLCVTYSTKCAVSSRYSGRVPTLVHTGISEVYIGIGQGPQYQACTFEICNFHFHYEAI